jgi:precorrin-6y C5,15-methyltransferase (decarboxylating) CbiE subunit
VALNTETITIVGCGPGAKDYLIPAGRAAIRRAKILAGAPRLLAAFASETQTRIIMKKGDVNALLDEMTPYVGLKKIAVLVTGDPGLRSLAKNVIERFGRSRCRVIPGISSVQTAFARAALDWHDARVITAHGGTPAEEPAEIAGLKKIAILAGGESSRTWLCSLASALGGEYQIMVCSNLTLPDERVEYISADEMQTVSLPSRSVVLFFDKGSL